MGGDYSQARVRRRSGAPLRHLRFNGERAGVLWSEGRVYPAETAKRGGKRERGFLGAEGIRPILPRCFLALGGHLRDRYELERWQRWSQRGCCPCLRGAEPSPTTAVSCCPPAAFGGLGKRFPLGCLGSCYHLKGGGQGLVSTRNGKDSLLCSCRPTKPLPHSKEGRIPETAAPNCVEAGFILPRDL